MDDYEQQISQCWQLNAEPWTQAVRGGQISSRVQVTDRAIIDSIVKFKPDRVLDLGCGEGWLVRVLCARGIAAEGVDGSAHLVAQAQLIARPQRIDKSQRIAKQQGIQQKSPSADQAENPQGKFYHFDYEAIAQGQLRAKADLLVSNFALLGKTSVDKLIKFTPNLLTGQGRLLIQTLHPFASDPSQAYQSGWRPGSWQGFGDQFKDPAPWYFRTLEDWLGLFKQAGYQLDNIFEPLHPQSLQPASIIFSLRLIRQSSAVC